MYDGHGDDATEDDVTEQNMSDLRTFCLFSILRLYLEAPAQSLVQ